MPEKKMTRNCRTFLSWDRINLIQHKINDDPGHRNVEPNGINEPREPAVVVESPLQSAIKRSYDERSNYRGEDRVGCKDREIDGPCQALSREFRRAQPEIIRSERDDGSHRK